jgi:hypothetical protein
MRLHFCSYELGVNILPVGNLEVDILAASNLKVGEGRSTKSDLHGHTQKNQLKMQPPELSFFKRGLGAN